MAKTLQQIKDEHAIKLGYRDFEQITGERSVFVIESILDYVAFRYAQEQKRELVEILEIINEGINTMDFTQLEGLHNEIESLITKHKQ